MLYEVDGCRGRGRPMTWNQVVEKDMKTSGLIKVEVQDQVKWRRLV